jgi:hypothetical protein
MAKMKDISIQIEEMLEMDEDYSSIVAFIQSVFPYYSADTCMELIIDAETALAIRYKDIEEYDDYMDGDHASALASAGWGTDEDYGYASDEY